MEHFDVFGDPIILGNYYGYIQRSSYNSDISVTFGKAVKITPTGKISIQASRVRSGSNGNLSDKSYKPQQSAVYSSILFPVTEEQAKSRV